MMKKVDLFKADRTMSTRVSEFMNTKVWGIVLRTRSNQIIKSHKKAIEAVADLGETMSKEDKERTISNHVKRIEEEQSKLKNLLDAESRFDFTDIDNALFKAYKADKISEGIVTWFEHYGLDVKDSVLLADIMNALSGKKAANSRTIINSGATQFNAKRTKNDILKVFYGALSENMLKAGTLKATEIPEDVREYFAPKKKATK